MAKKIELPKGIKSLGMDKKKFAKKNDIPYKLKGDFSKKEKKRNERKFDKKYAESQLNSLDTAIRFLIEHATEESNKKIEKTKKRVDKVVNNSGLMRDIIKVYDEEPAEYKHIIYLPNILMQSILYYSNENISDEEKEIGAKIDKEAYVEFAESILRKQIKAYKKNGISKENAFQIACIIPSAKLFEMKTNFHYRKLINALFDIAKENSVDIAAYFHSIYDLSKKKFEKKEFLDEFCLQYLLRKQTNKAAKFTDTQKDLQETLNAWTLVHLNEISRNRSKNIIKKYIKSRKRAEEYKTDGKRVISLIAHSNANSEYPKLKEVLLDVINDNSSNELYLS